MPKKITFSAAKIKLGLEKKLSLGDINAKRDWGFAGDFVEAMYLMLQAKKPKDYVIATGETHSVAEILDIAFSEVGLNWHDYVEVDKSLIRPVEKFDMVGDISKIKNELGWQPRKSFQELIKLMVSEDLKSIQKVN